LISRAMASERNGGKITRRFPENLRPP
jgi:hypothetical protein